MPQISTATAHAPRFALKDPQPNNNNENTSKSICQQKSSKVLTTQTPPRATDKASWLRAAPKPFHDDYVVKEHATPDSALPSRPSV